MRKKTKHAKHIKQDKTQKTEIKSKPHHIYLGEFDRITYIYSKDLKGNYIKVINVSYEILIEQKWRLVSRYDSEHGYLHSHMTISISDKSEVVLPTTRVIKKGAPKDWLSWAINDIKVHFFEYRKGYLKRSHIKTLY